MKILLDAGAIVSLKTKLGHDAIWYGEKSSCAVIINMLKNKTSSENFPHQLKKNSNKPLSCNEVKCNKNAREHLRNVPIDLQILLEQLDLTSYLTLFEKKGLDLQHFLTLTDQDLKEVGVVKMGPRRKMTSAIARWHSNASIGCSVEKSYADKVELERLELTKKLSLANEELELTKTKVRKIFV